MTTINLTEAEIQSGHDQQGWAEGLILQLPIDHDGRNSWLLNYGRSQCAIDPRKARNISFNDYTQAAELGP